MLGHENWTPEVRHWNPNSGRQCRLGFANLSLSRKDYQLCLGKLDPRQVHILSRYLPAESICSKIFTWSPRAFASERNNSKVLRRKDVIQQRGTNSAADGPSRICQIESSCLIETACGLDAVSALAGGFDGNGKIQCQQVRGRDAGTILREGLGRAPAVRRAASVAPTRARAESSAGLKYKAASESVCKSQAWAAMETQGDPGLFLERLEARIDKIPGFKLRRGFASNDRGRPVSLYSTAANKKTPKRERFLFVSHS